MCVCVCVCVELHCKNTWLNYYKCMATGISGFIEQVGSMIRGIPKHELASTPVSVHSQYPVQNQIIASRWLYMNWYLLASRQVSLLA